MSALRDDNERLSRSVAELRAERRVQDRKIRDLEHQLALAVVKSRQGDPVPQLPVEVVAPPAVPEGQRVVGIADDGTEIVYAGDAALGKPAVIDLAPPRELPPARSYEARGRGDREVARRSARPSRAAVRSDAGPSRGNAADASRAADEYRAAVALVRSGEKDAAIAALRKFIAAYPRHDYADNAQYWLGEAYYAHRDYENALLAFRATIETYPRGNKVPDALLKVGYCYQALGKTDKARAVLEQVVNLYPKSEPAALAAKRLETP